MPSITLNVEVNLPSGRVELPVPHREELTLEQSRALCRQVLARVRQANNNGRV